MVSTRSHDQVTSRKRFNPATHALEGNPCTPSRQLAATHTAPRHRAPRRITRKRTTRERFVAFTCSPDHAGAARPVFQAYTFSEIKEYFWNEYIPSRPELIDKFREQQREQDTLMVLLKWRAGYPVHAESLEGVGRKLVDDVLFDIDTTDWAKTISR